MTNLSKIALTVLIVGVICMVVAPLLFTALGYTLTETGDLGDSIGGITAPISSLVGSILVFLALRGQIVANRITQRQIQDQKVEEEMKKEVSYISELYKYFVNSIQTYETKYFKGHRAIMKVMNSLVESERKNAHDESQLYYGTAAELYGTLQLGKLFLEQVNKSRIDEHDKRYFKELVKHHYDSFIVPYLAKKTEQPACEVCGEMHNGIPFRMLSVIQETVVLF